MAKRKQKQVEIQRPLLTRRCKKCGKIWIAETLRDRSDKENVKTARWYLERKAADEFSTKQAVAFEGAVIELSLEEKEKKLKELVEEFDPNGE